MSTLANVQGSQADAREFDSSGTLVGIADSGPHAGHVVTVETAKHNCGAFAVDIACSCGSRWSNDMNGCWQSGHQREASGDATLADFDRDYWRELGLE